MHTAIAMRIHSLPVDFTELSHPAVDNKKTMCYITNRTKKIVSPGRKVGILNYSELCTCDFANVALNSYEFVCKHSRTRTTDSGGNETWNL